MVGCAALMACASSPAADPDIVRPGPGEQRLEQLPGPLLVFSSYPSALLAACQKILSKPGAAAGPRGKPGFDVRWRVGTEYCAWIYYTPDGKYALSKLTDQTDMRLAEQGKRCLLPYQVNDPRFPPDSIQYVFALHNHLFDDPLSTGDMSFILNHGFAHGFEHETQDGSVRISAVAFFSNDPDAPRCDGFYQYIPLTRQVLKWTRTSQWECTQKYWVDWDEDWERPSVRETNAPCFEDTSP